MILHDSYEWNKLQPFKSHLLLCEKLQYDL